MKIYMIGQKGLPAISGGVERHVEELGERLAAKGHDVFVYARKGYSNKKIKTHKGMKLIYLPTLYLKGVEAGLHTLFASIHVLFQKADIIHYHAIGPASFTWIPRLLKPKSKVVFTFHCQDYRHQKWGAFARWYLKLGERLGSRFAHKVITVSKGLRAYVKKTYDVYAEYIPNGVPDFKGNMDVGNLKRWDLKPSGYFLTVSRLIKHKGIHYLIDAYKKLDTDKKLVIVGDSSYTDDYKKLLLKKAEGNPNIIFTGQQGGDTLLSLYANAYVFVQPSEAEGLSIALLEAMKFGKCCVVSDIDENVEVVEDNGILFQNKNSLDLAKKLQYSLDNENEVNEKARLSKESVQKNYSWENITDSVERLYK